MPGTAGGVANHQSFCERTVIVAAGRLDREDLAAGLHQQDVFLADMAEQFAVLEFGERHASAQVGPAWLLVFGHPLPPWAVADQSSELASPSSSWRVSALSRNTPSMRLVTRSAPGLCAPRVVMQ